MFLQPGTTLGPYQIASQLGSGGMGVVYQAHDPRLDRHVTIKRLPPHLTRDETAKQRFLQEAQAVSVAQQHGVADDGRRRAVPKVTRSTSVHPGFVPCGELT